MIVVCSALALTPTYSKKQGSLVLGGGGNLPQSVYDEFVLLAGGSAANIIVIPGASRNPNLAAKRWKNVTILQPRSPEEVLDAEFSLPIATATGVWFCGGDQLRLSKMYKDTGVHRELVNLLKRGGVIGGTSAGASIVSDVMIYNETEARGLAFCTLIVDQHFGQRKRLPRLLKLLEKYPGLEGVGNAEKPSPVSPGEAFVSVNEKAQPFLAFAEGTMI